MYSIILSSSTSEILVDRRAGWAYGPNLDIGIGSTVAVTLNDVAYIVGGYQNFDFSRVYMLKVRAFMKACVKVRFNPNIMSLMIIPFLNLSELQFSQ